VFLVDSTNKVASIDAIPWQDHQNMLLPDARRATAPHRDRAGHIVWYTDFSRVGFLGRLDRRPARSRWPSPTAESAPDGIVFTKGALWYNEVRAKPTRSCASIQLARNSSPGRSGRRRYGRNMA